MNVLKQNSNFFSDFLKYLLKNEISCLTCALPSIKGEWPFPSITGSETTGSLCNEKKVCRL